MENPAGRFGRCGKTGPARPSQSNRAALGARTEGGRAYRRHFSEGEQGEGLTGSTVARNEGGGPGRSGLSNERTPTSQHRRKGLIALRGLPEHTHYILGVATHRYPTGCGLEVAQQPQTWLIFH